jgi:hypothetical protein
MYKLSRRSKDKIPEARDTQIDDCDNTEENTGIGYINIATVDGQEVANPARYHILTELHRHL